MFIGIILIVLGAGLSLISCIKAETMVENGNIAAVMWYWPWVVLGFLAVIKGVNVVGAV